MSCIDSDTAKVCRGPVRALESPAGLLSSSSFMNALKDLNSRFSLSAFTLSSRAVKFLQASGMVHYHPHSHHGHPLQEWCQACQGHSGSCPSVGTHPLSQQRTACQ